MAQFTRSKTSTFIEDLIGEQVEIDEHISFVVQYQRFKLAGTGYICDLSGEFLKDGKRFAPPKIYMLTNVRVMTQELRICLIL